MTLKLGVNIDHVATLREVRKVAYPDLIAAMKLAISGGADGITIHLREDRRHIQTEDLINLTQEDIHLNLEIAPDSDVIEIALRHPPHECCIVPEKRKELTTEGGLDVISQFEKIQSVTKQLQAKKIKVSVFIDAEIEIIKASKELGVDMIEIHTGDYANATSEEELKMRCNQIKQAAEFGYSIGLKVNAGHGLTLDNVVPIAKIEQIAWLNIGHFIVARSVLVGLEQSVREMKLLMTKSRSRESISTKVF